MLSQSQLYWLPRPSGSLACAAISLTDESWFPIAATTVVFLVYRFIVS